MPYFGNIGAAAGGVVQGMQADQQRQAEQQMMQMRALQIQQTQQQMADQQAWQQALQHQNQPPVQSPMPGQASVPSQPQGQPTPPAMPGSMPMAPPAAPLRPWQSMPTTPVAGGAPDASGPAPVSLPPKPTLAPPNPLPDRDTARMQFMQKNYPQYNTAVTLTNVPQAQKYVDAANKQFDTAYSDAQRRYDKDEADYRLRMEKSGKLRTVIKGTNEIQQEWDPKGEKWIDIGKGPRFKPGSDGTGGGAKPVSKDTIDYYATQSLNGDNSWQVGLARGKVGQQLIAAVKDRIPQMAKEQGITPQEASANKPQRDALAKSLVDRQKYVAAGTQFVNNFTKQADIVDKYLAPGVGGQSSALNRWIQAGRKSIAGDPDVTALDTAMRGLAREHQRIVTGVTSNAQLHASAQETADQLLNISQNEEQVKATLKVMREEAKNALDSGNEEVDLLKTQLKTFGTPSKTTAAPAAATSAPPAPKAGDVQTDDRGRKYRFKGGNPADMSTWERI